MPLSFCWIVAVGMEDRFPPTAAFVKALLPQLALIDANREFVPEGAQWVAAFERTLAVAGVLFQWEFDAFIQQYLLGIGWPVDIADEDERVTRWAPFKEFPSHCRQRCRGSMQLPAASTAAAKAGATTPYTSCPVFLCPPVRSYRQLVDGNQQLTAVDWLLLSFGAWLPLGEGPLPGEGPEVVLEWFPVNAQARRNLIPCTARAPAGGLPLCSQASTSGGRSKPTRTAMGGCQGASM